MNRRIVLPLFRHSVSVVKMQEIGKLIAVIGLALVAIGAIIWKTGGLGGLGKLPGDIFLQKGDSSFYFPVVTCIVISVALTLLGWLFRK